MTGQQRVIVAGAGMTTFTRSGPAVQETAQEAVAAALADAGARADQVQIVACANVAGGLITGHAMVRAESALRSTGLLGATIISVEAACASAAATLHLAVTAVRADSADVAMAAGAERLTSPDRLRTPASIGTVLDLEQDPAVADGTAGEGRWPFVDIYADLALCYIARTGGALRWLHDGTPSLGGQCPVNPSGELLCRGYPIGATGAAQVVELVRQLVGSCRKPSSAACPSCRRGERRRLDRRGLRSRRCDDSLPVSDDVRRKRSSPHVGPGTREKNMSVADRTIQNIRDLIVSGQLNPGQRLPAEADLAARLHVSRNSLREAVRALREVRVLEVRRGDGTYVSNLEPETLLGGLSLTVDLMGGNTILEIFEIRRLFEPQATGLAALRVTEHDLVGIAERLHKMRQTTRVEDLISLDYEFHRRIMQVTGNATLCMLMDALGTRTIRARVWRGIDQGGVKSFTLEQHGRIVEALAARDPALAIGASTVHLSESERWLRRVINQERHPGLRDGHDRLQPADDQGCR